ncbi:unnamed protein product [Mytilus edulis]|uniref:SUEL-type lectin domain-containing protein n=1 Tax=Mytilus edulis TaxID=6550 RepID=A0A8S3RE79_MYTED|nr:unnamed protein product [Mytilus edulis]
MMPGLLYFCFCCIFVYSLADNCGKTLSIQEDILHALVSMQRPSCGGSKTNGITNVIVCEAKYVYLRCKYPFKIKIKSAIYGRSEGKHICPEGPVQTTSCKSKTSDSKIKAQCNGKEICRVQADHRQYGDPCGGITNVIVCEAKYVYLRCKYPFKIKIKSAIYGRSEGKHICPEGPVQTTSCKSKTSDSKIKAQCNGKEICRVQADHRQYGDPCGGTYKYLDVKYMCS